MCESCGVPYEIVPAFAAWQHVQARHGFEVAYFATSDDDCRITGCTVGFQDGDPWIINYEIALDGQWCTRRAVVASHTPAGRYRVALEHDGNGAWKIDGVAAPQLAGCLDVDLESSALTNAFPVHRIGFEPGATASAPAAYVRTNLGVERLE